MPETIEQWSKNNFGQAGLANGFGSLNLRSRLNFGLGFNLRVCVLANRLGADVFHFWPNAFRRVVVFSRNQRCPRKQNGPTRGQHTRSKRTPHQRGNNAVGKETLLETNQRRYRRNTHYREKKPTHSTNSVVKRCNNDCRRRHWRQ